MQNSPVVGQSIYSLHAYHISIHHGCHISKYIKEALTESNCFRFLETAKLWLWYLRPRDVAFSTVVLRQPCTDALHVAYTRSRMTFFSEQNSASPRVILSLYSKVMWLKQTLRNRLSWERASQADNFFSSWRNDFSAKLQLEWGIVLQNVCCFLPFNFLVIAVTLQMFPQQEELRNPRTLELKCHPRWC